MKYLVTGANGFIGKHFIKETLKQGNEVFAIVTNKDDLSDISSSKLHIFELFFEGYSRISQLVNSDIDFVFHFAWHGLSGAEAKDLNIQVSNILATAKLLEQIKILNAKKFIFASTMNSIEVRNFLNNPKEFKTRGIYVHVSAKISAEIYARTFCEENHIEYNEGIIAMAYGEDNKSKMITNVFIYCLLNKITPKLVKGENQYDLIYVDDIVSAMIHIGEKGINKKSYYIGHNWNKSFREIFTEIKNIISPDFDIYFGDYPDDNKIDFSIINRNELTEDTGWTIKTEFKDSIIKTARWIKESKIVFYNG